LWFDPNRAILASHLESFMTQLPDHALAAVTCPKGSGADDILSRVAHALKAEGFIVCGTLQKNFPDPVLACPIMHVENIATGALSNITQNLGAGSTGCRLDPVALAGVAAELLRSLDGPADLMILNRFGKDEAEGRGLRSVAEKSVAAGVPVLTVLRPEFLAAWQDFTGNESQLLDADFGKIMNWARTAVVQARRLRTAA
jgi:nucleoside-triphosphatase THEP1